MLENNSEQKNDDRSEITYLREKIQEKLEEIDFLQNLVFDLFEPVEETDLNQESSNAGGYYIQKLFNGAPTEARHIALNACAHGFSMGWRACEKNAAHYNERKMKERKNESSNKSST